MKILLVDDHTVIRDGVRRLIASFSSAEIFEATCCEDAMPVFLAERPLVVVLDLNLPGTSGLDVMRRMLAEVPATRVLIFSMHNAHHYVARALRGGAYGYVTKSASAAELLEALRKVIAGGRYVERELASELATTVFSETSPNAQLSERDLEILRLLTQGRSLSEIAEALRVSYKTIANGCTMLKQKLLIERTADLIRYATDMHST
jgi:DNA-binding NarL/FixJ family response regulator